MKHTGKREQAIVAFLREPSIIAAAKATGIGEKTLRRWLKDDPEFATAYGAARQRAFDLALGTLQEATGEAVATLRRNLDPEVPHAVQVRAALGILEQAFKG